MTKVWVPVAYGSALVSYNFSQLAGWSFARAAREAPAGHELRARRREGAVGPVHQRVVHDSRTWARVVVREAIGGLPP